MLQLTKDKSYQTLLKLKTILLGYKTELKKVEEKLELYTERDVIQMLYSLKLLKKTKMLYKLLNY